MSILRWWRVFNRIRAGLRWLSLIPLLASAAGTSSWFVRPWLTDDGLLDNDVTGVAQDRQGYLWVATDGGLTRFDGVRFREVELSTPSQRTRPQHIRAMMVENDGTVWVAVDGPLVFSLAAARTNVFTARDGLPNFRPSSLAQDHDGSVWVGYADGSACRIANGTVKRFTSGDGLAGTGSCEVAGDLQGQVWFARAGQLSVWHDGKISHAADLPDAPARMAAARPGGLWIFAGMDLLKLGESGKLERILTLNSSAAGMRPSAVYEDHSGVVWLGTLAGGLFRVQGTNVLSVPVSYPDVLCLAEDREANLWAGTGGGGLNRLRPRVLELLNTENGLPFASVRSVCEDTNGNLWAVAQNGTLAKQEANRWQTVSAADNWAGTGATCVTSDGRGGVWVGTSHDGLSHWANGQVTVFARTNGLAGATVRALLTDSGGGLWIATDSPGTVQRLQDGKIQTYLRPSTTRTVRAMAQDKSGTVWLGTQTGHLLRVDGNKLVDATATTLPRPKPIRCLYAAPDGDLWIGYAGAGLGRIRDGKFSSISTERGLHDAYICSMTLDDGGGFWFCSNHGIFQVRQGELESALAGKLDTVRSVLFGREESLPSLQGNFGYCPGFTRSRDGQIWFPTRSGLVVINPNQTQPNHLVPPVAIERVLVDGTPISGLNGGAAAIPPRHRRVDIEFTALSFAAPENVGFRCQLEGWDENWINVPRPQRSVSYTRLPAGDYKFRVIACNNAGIWNETGATLPFRVEPFVWQTWWFRATVLSALLGGVALSALYYSHRKYRLRLKKLEQEAVLQKERARIARDIHDELGANLTQISLLGKFTQHDLAEPEKARTHVEKIAAIARQGIRSVDEIVWAVNPRNDTLGQLLDYAGQYAVDFLRTADIRCRIDFPEKVPARELPSDLRHGLFMMVKEALNNTVKHAGASEVVLRAEMTDNLLILSIVDNGRGFTALKTDALSDGLRNMKQRASDLGGNCLIESEPEQGTKVRVELRLP